jgi:xanthosine utilization system XapX-like protein
MRKDIVFMEEYLLYFAAVCAVIFVFSLIPDKKEALVTFLLRAVFGILAIYFLNKLFYHFEIMAGGRILRAGINICTVTVSGMLGLPGIILIYFVLYFL